MPCLYDPRSGQARPGHPSLFIETKGVVAEHVDTFNLASMGSHSNQHGLGGAGNLCVQCRLSSNLGL